MVHQFQFRLYCRSFQQPLQTHHGLWHERQGILARLTDEAGYVGFGEIAPLPWFGSETQIQAAKLCQQLPTQLSKSEIQAIPATLPACRFGVESAWQQLARSQSPLHPNRPQPEPDISTLCGLLPTGVAALTHWCDLWGQGYRTLKWKIGVAPVEQELSLFQQLVQSIQTQIQSRTGAPEISKIPPAIAPPLNKGGRGDRYAIYEFEEFGSSSPESRARAVKLRLDANGGLSVAAAERWLQVCDALAMGDGLGVEVEFLEQPLPVGEEVAMQQLASQYQTPLALDESVATLQDLQRCCDRGWSGIVVIKPSIAGFPSQLRQVCCDRNLDWVLSSVFETAIGRQAIFQLAENLVADAKEQGRKAPNRALGFGLSHWFPANDPLSANRAETLWQNC